MIKTHFEVRLSILNNLITNTSKEVSKIETRILNEPHTDHFMSYHNYYVFETSQILIDMLAYEKIELSNIPTELRANEHIYTFVFQNKDRIESSIIALLDDILNITTRIHHPLYCYAWQNLLKLLAETIKWNKRHLYNDRKECFRGEVEDHYEKFIAIMQEMAEKQELFQ